MLLHVYQISFEYQVPDHMDPAEVRHFVETALSQLQISDAYRIGKVTCRRAMTSRG